MAELKFQSVRKKRDSYLRLNFGAVFSVLVYITVLTVSFYSNMFFMNQLLIAGAILFCILLIMALNKVN